MKKELYLYRIAPNFYFFLSVSSVKKTKNYEPKAPFQNVGSTATHPRIIASNTNAQVFWTEKMNKQQAKLVMTRLE